MPADDRLLTELARLFELRDRQNMGATISALEAIREQHPDDPNVLYEVGGAYDTAGQEEVALGFYERAMELGLTGDWLRKCLSQYGSTLRNLGRMTDSLAVFERGRIEFPESVSMVVFEAITLHAAGRPGAALGSMLELVADRLPSEEIERYEAAIRGNALYLKSLD
ncbi:MAG: hypothetical protein JWO10_1196 [Microbacteriaceae bacterium]|nr:hypothetical protein [Microbacteriaceae bacterium]